MMENNLFLDFVLCLSIVMGSPIHEHTEPPWELLAFYVIVGVVAYVVLCFMAKKPAPPHRNLLIVIYACCLAGMVIAGLPVHWHIEFPWQEPIPIAFYAIFGFAACVFLIYFAKGLRLWLPKDYDYYEKKRRGRE
ncbi:MAG: hypothetical protein U9O85_08000 [Euryarchaeota archaeon]|nr:hypothetical protein [Euryarchaeota archaeon]